MRRNKWGSKPLKTLLKHILTVAFLGGPYASLLLFSVSLVLWD
jgi:hypothetical protein